MPVFRFRSSYIIPAIAVASVLSVGFLWALKLFGFRINVSNSLPPGLYRSYGERGQWKRGQIVGLCPPDSSFLRQLKQHKQVYGGGCPGNYMVWMKPVVAIAGDTVEVSPDGVSVNGHLIGNSKPLKQTPTGLKLPQIEGHYVVQPETVWLVSDYNPKSIDSRYLGAISTRQLQRPVVPVIVFP